MSLSRCVHCILLQLIMKVCIGACFVMFALLSSSRFPKQRARPFRLKLHTLVFALIATCSQASAQDLNYQSMQFKGKSPRGDIVSTELTMPFFSSAKTDIAANINDRIFIGQLETLAPLRWKPFFGEADKVNIGGIENQSFDVSRLDPNITTIDFDTEYCGAYCEAANYFYNFETQTGRFINLTDLVTRGGAQELMQRLKTEKIRLYREQLRQLKMELKSLSSKKGKAQQEDIADIEDRIALNTQCLRDSQASTVTNASTEDLRYLRYKLLEKELMIVSGRCSNHASRALDDVGEINLNLTYESLRKHLSSYGQSLLLNEGESKSTSIIGQVLRGKLGNNSISMVIQADTKNTVSALYFYDKYRKAISLFGTEQHGLFELIERDEAGQEQAKFQLRLSGNGLVGHWLGKTKLKLDLRAP
jgi:hypothetical protein